MTRWRKTLIATLVAVAAALALSPSAEALSVLGCQISTSGVSCPF